MWKPNEVVTGQKRQAVALWMLMISIAVAYTSWLVDGAMKKRIHPTTWSQVSNTVYAYPDVWVCLYDTYGCDERHLEEECVKSSNTTEAGKPSAWFYRGGEYEQEVPVVGGLRQGWCMEFKTSQVTAFLGQERDAGKFLDYFTLKASWYPGGVAGNSTTCVQNGEKWKSHREWVYILLHHPETDATTTGLQTPYSCITSESNSHTFIYMGIGLNEQRNIMKDDTAMYNVQTIVSAVYKDEVDRNVTNPYAYLELQIQQEPDSWEVVTEIDPLSVGEILGSIGGFWDLILILWPMFFVAATNQGPHLKLRKFKKSVAGVTGFVGVTTGVERSRKHTTKYGDQSGRPADPTDQDIEEPHWETTPPGTHHLV